MRISTASLGRRGEGTQSGAVLRCDTSTMRPEDESLVFRK